MDGQVMALGQKRLYQRAIMMASSYHLSYLSLPQTKLSAASVLPVPL